MSVVAPAALRAIRRAVAGGGIRIVAVDGPSGAGKSTFARALAAAWPSARPVLVRLDDAYPGWHGLERGADAVRRGLVAPIARDAVGVLARWDWAGDRPGPRQGVRPGHPLIVEGCGAFAATDRLPALRVWVHAPDDVRKAAALGRDAGAFDPYWEVWDRQWRRHTARTRPDRAADLRVSGVREVRPNP
ncbi:ATP-binding protein [Agromyces sp. MMS24-JH15]|uniref:ATP-binding protein n=1 Tax=Agromyces sp. MMS24-JH15 TaxID=3243765 RepID=UPI00374A8DA9